MRVSEAKRIAREWVQENVAMRPDFAGAFLFGSAVHKDDSEEYSPAFDLDLRVLLDRQIPDGSENPSGKFAQRKLLYRGIVLETVYESRDRYRDVATILESPFMAVALDCFTRPNVLFDPTGDLERIREGVSVAFRNEAMARKRCAAAQKMVLGMLEYATDKEARLPGYTCSLYRQVVWFYGGAMPLAAQIPCIANLQGMTLRKGFVAARERLTQLGRGDLYQSLLHTMGVHDLTEAQVRVALCELAAAYDYALTVIRTPFYGDYDVQAICRPMVIGGARELLEAGDHREIMPWIASQGAWVQNAIDNDGAEPHKATYGASYQALLDRLGASTADQLTRKGDQMRELLPALMSLAEEIIESHPDIVHGA
jgi:hypothetical protein